MTVLLRSCFFLGKKSLFFDLALSEVIRMEKLGIMDLLVTNLGSEIVWSDTDMSKEENVEND
jgi:hypothetical protein